MCSQNPNHLVWLVQVGILAYNSGDKVKASEYPKKQNYWCGWCLVRDDRGIPSDVYKKNTNPSESHLPFGFPQSKSSFSEFLFEMSLYDILSIRKWDFIVLIRDRSSLYVVTFPPILRSSQSTSLIRRVFIAFSKQSLEQKPICFYASEIDYHTSITFCIATIIAVIQSLPEWRQVPIVVWVLESPTNVLTRSSKSVEISSQFPSLNVFTYFTTSMA